MTAIPDIPQDFASTLSPMLGSTPWSTVVESLQQSLPKTITLNTSRINHEQFINIAIQEWRDTKLSARWSEQTYQVTSPQDRTSIWTHRLHQCGYYYIQESAASIPASILTHLIGKQQKPMVVLDLAASPGGKTAQLSHLLYQDNAQHIIRANDSNANRMKALGHNIQRMNIPNIISSCINGERFGTLYPELFDAILLDAPCSGEGTSFKSDASLAMRKPDRIKAISSLQYQLIVSAYKALKPGGYMIYSTCTLNPYENEIIIKRLIEYTKGEINLIPIDRKDLDHGITDYLWSSILTLDQSRACLRARPHRHHTGGFFIAAIRKPVDYVHDYTLSYSASTDSTHHTLSHTIKPHHPTKNNTKKDHHTNNHWTYHSSASKQEWTDVDNYLNSYRWISLDQSQQRIIKRRESYNIISESFEHISHLAKRESIGIPILRVSGNYKKSIRPLHGLVCLMNNLTNTSPTSYQLDINTTQAQHLISGTYQENLPIVRDNEDNLDIHASYRLMVYQWLPISIAKRVQSVRKVTFRG